VVGRPFPPKLCQPGRTLLCGGALNRPFGVVATPFVERTPPFENGRVVCAFPFRCCIAGAVGIRDPFIVLLPRLLIVPFCIRDLAMICCARCCCWVKGRGVNVGLL